MKRACAFPATVSGRISLPRNSLVVLVLLLAGAPFAAHTDEIDRVRQLRLHGEIKPLTQILEHIERRYPGTLLDAELEREHGTLIYEIKMLGDDHIVREIIVDARSGRIMSTEPE